MRFFKIALFHAMNTVSYAILLTPSMKCGIIIKALSYMLYSMLYRKVQPFAKRDIFILFIYNLFCSNDECTYLLSVISTEL